MPDNDIEYRKVSLVAFLRFALTPEKDREKLFFGFEAVKVLRDLAWVCGAYQYA